MQNIAIHRAHELPVDARQAVERVLGRTLQEDEEVSIMALSPHPAPVGETRQILARQLEERISKTAARASHVSDEEIEETIGEALDHVRSHTE